MTEVSRDSWSAWQSLCEQGGIEVEGRDADLVEALRVELDPSAADLRAAIVSTSTDALVRALFGRIAPFAVMFADIVAYFKAAGAYKGRDHWRVKVEEENLELKDFEEFSATWSSVAGLVDLPALGFGSLWDYLRLLRDHPAGDPLGFSRRSSEDPDVDDWFRTYERGGFPSLPQKLDPARLPGALVETASIAAVVLQRLRDRAGNRGAMYEAYGAAGVDGKRVHVCDLDDAFALGTILQNETDYWLGSTVLLLDRWRTASEADLAALGTRLTGFTAAMARVHLPLEVSIADLERVLALPVWRTRHELYAIWIATRVVAALPDREIELHHEDGRIVFAFKETVLATIKDVDLEVRLVGERRTRLESPVGEGRKGGAQPDLGLWVDAPEGERCLMVIEVKHYRKAARRRFHTVLIDYAAAHPKAQVLLVNHGPVSDMLAGVDAATAARCVQIGDLMPTNVARLEEFKERVRDIMPRVLLRGTAAPVSQDDALMIDVSGSMQMLLADGVFEDYIAHWGGRFATVALVDDGIRMRCTVDDAVRLAREYVGGSTSLADPLRILVEGREGVVILTDTEGRDQIEALRSEFMVTSSALGDLGLFCVTTTKGC